MAVSVLLVEVDEHLGVGARPEAVAAPAERLPQRGVVVDLAVQGGPDGPSSLVTGWWPPSCR